MNINKLQLMIIGILSLIIILPGQVKADDSYVPMIREDRVWEYSTSVPYQDQRTFYTYKFDGSLTFEGKTYHAFSNINTKVFTWQSDIKDYALVSDVDLGENGTKFLLREESGKVYVLVDHKDNESQFVPFNTSKPIKELEQKLASESNIAERVLYDTSCVEDTVYLDLNYGFQMLSEDPFYEDPYYSTCIQSVYEKADIDGQECAEFNYSYPNTGYTIIKWIEGIGIVEEGGFLPVFTLERYSNPGPLNSHATISRFPTDKALCYTRLRSVYTTDGRVLYGEAPIGSGVERTEAETLTVGAADGAVTARGAGNIEMTVRGLDGVCVASASGDCEVTIPTTGIGRGLYIVTASDGARTRTLKLRL